MHNHRTHQQRERLSRMLRLPLAVLLTVPALSFAAAAIGSPTPAAAAEDFLNVLPSSEITAEWSNISGNVGTVPMPNCGSINIAPQSNLGNNNSTWTVTSQIGSGSTVFVGQEWTVRGQIDTQVPFKGTFGNDGPDPLNLDLIPQGPVVNGAAPVADQVGAFGGPYKGGDGDTGPVAARGAWGYKFDANSNPKAASSAGDGADAIVTVTLKATGPGEISMKRFKVTGHDGTPKAGPVDCEIYLGWYWNVIEMQDPIANLDFATTDASYPPIVPGDRTTGRHGVIVDVLANDDDPNENFGCDGQCGIDPDPDVRIASWDANRMNCGDPNLNGKIPTVANFNSLSSGPCTVYPALDAEVYDEASYTMVQRSGLRTAESSVLVTVVTNQPPTVNTAEDAVQAGDNFLASLTPFHDDFENDPVTCVAESLVLAPLTGGVSASIDEDCKLSWNDLNTSNYTGLITLTYRACDSHATLQNIPRGAKYDQHFSDAAKDDLSATTTRRCAIGKVELTREAVAPAFGLPITAVNDYDVLDRPYSSDGILPFHLDIDVKANDASFAGANNISVQLYGGQYPPSQAGVGVVGNRLQVASTDASPNMLTIGYRICGDFPNLGGAQRCATAKAIITIRGNKEPVTADDLFGVTSKALSARQVAGNDFDPENEGAMTCSTSNHPSSPANAFDSVQVSSDCTITFDAADAFTGDATIEYNICDNHKLADPLWERTTAPGYGTFGAVVGGPASRCAPGLARFTFKNFVIALPPAVEAVPNLPICVDDAFQVKSNTMVAVDVLANDSDLGQNNQPGVLSLPPPAEETTSQDGQISSSGGKIQYTPKAGFTGVDTANYNGLDSDGNGCSAVIRFTVVTDTDGDGIPDAIDPDANGDGIPDAQQQPSNPQMPGDSQLPATGSNTGQATGIAIYTMLLGLGLVTIAGRRRSSTTAKG